MSVACLRRTAAAIHRHLRYCAAIAEPIRLSYSPCSRRQVEPRSNQRRKEFLRIRSRRADRFLSDLPRLPLQRHSVRRTASRKRLSTPAKATPRHDPGSIVGAANVADGTAEIVGKLTMGASLACQGRNFWSHSRRHGAVYLRACRQNGKAQTEYIFTLDTSSFEGRRNHAEDFLPPAAEAAAGKDATTVIKFFGVHRHYPPTARW